jgi:putative addiction module killer protein
MIEVRQTQEFSAWLHRLRDANAVARIVARIRRMQHGNPGGTRSVGEAILEMRIDHRPGYRIYYLPRGQTVILLCEATSVRSGRISSGLRCWPRICDAQDDTI